MRSILSKTQGISYHFPKEKWRKEEVWSNESITCYVLSSIVCCEGWEGRMLKASVGKFSFSMEMTFLVTKVD